MNPTYKLTLRLVDPEGKECLAQNIELDPLDFSLSIPKPFLALFEETVLATNRVKRRREILMSFAGYMGEAFADFLEDADGWNGLERQFAASPNHKIGD